MSHGLSTDMREKINELSLPTENGGSRPQNGKPQNGKPLNGKPQNGKPLDLID